MIYALAVIGAITVTVTAIRCARQLWKTRNWKPTRWLCIPR
jgi:hypothetical protein